uniref:Uncharacterized protein n=1 Tax=Aegilops tauschii subsp. strangulata TaxID=200361 RepID=A0A453D859_AEGTS
FPSLASFFISSPAFHTSLPSGPALSTPPNHRITRAMVGPSPSPSGSSRRLSELLEEQQEPFSLHLYLLEKGCSPTTLDPAGGCGVASLPCWPRSRGTSPAPRRVTVSKRTPASGLLSKFLHGTAAPASTKRKKKLRSAAIGPCSVEGEKTASKRKNAVEARRAEAKDDEGESYDDDDDDSSKQLSPVSVLERRPFEKPPRAYAESKQARSPHVLPRAIGRPSCTVALSSRSNTCDHRRGHRRLEGAPGRGTQARVAPAESCHRKQQVRRCPHGDFNNDDDDAGAAPRTGAREDRPCYQRSTFEPDV